MKRIALIVAFAVAIGVFMTLDRLTLHWYTPDTSAPSPAVRELAAEDAPSPSLPPRSNRHSVGPNAAATPTPAAWSDPDTRDAFETLWAAGLRATYRVRYQTSDRAGGKGFSYLLVNMPPSARLDTIPAGQDEPSSQIFVDSSGDTIACSFGSSDRQCQSIQPFVLPLPLAAGPIVFPAANEFPSQGVVEMHPRAIAGVVARCFQVPAGDHESATEYCFSGDGVPVYTSGPSGLVEASDLASRVSSLDIQPPGP